QTKQADQNEQSEPGQIEQNKQTEESQLQRIFLPVSLNQKILAQDQLNEQIKMNNQNLSISKNLSSVPLNQKIPVQKALALKIPLNLSSLKQQLELLQSIKGTLMLKIVNLDII
ncbi:1603_t:CDS:2, partial [Gigaspora margarita]